MTKLDELKTTVKLCMFDLYGTIVDMQSGLTAAIRPYLQAKDWRGEPSRLVTWWRRTHFENSMIDALLHREHLPYREISRISLTYTLERAGIAHTQDEVQTLVTAIERLQPFPEVVASLERLAQRYRLVVLSNGDPDMLEAAKPHIGFAFERMISVAVASTFKPHVATYRTAAEVVGLAPHEILFIANHAFDCVGAKAFGMATCFVDRRQRPFGNWPYPPDLIVGHFAELAAKLV
jgi:2-haloacid dehalogenase